MMPTAPAHDLAIVLSDALRCYRNTRAGVDERVQLATQLRQQQQSLEAQSMNAARPPRAVSELVAALAQALDDPANDNPQIVQLRVRPEVRSFLALHDQRPARATL